MPDLPVLYLLLPPKKPPKIVDDKNKLPDVRTDKPSAKTSKLSLDLTLCRQKGLLYSNKSKVS